MGGDMMQGLINGLLDMIPDVDTAIEQITTYVNDHFKKQLDIWPTKADQVWNWASALGDQFEAGGLTFAIGDSGYGLQDRGGQLGVTNIVNQNIQGSVVTEADLVRLMRQELISIGRDNGNSVFGNGIFAPA
jgi:hypothetical protein